RASARTHRITGRALESAQGARAHETLGRARHLRRAHRRHVRAHTDLADAGRPTPRELPGRRVERGPHRARARARSRRARLRRAPRAFLDRPRRHRLARRDLALMGLPLRSSFAPAFWLLPEPRRSALVTLHRFCRAADESVDGLPAGSPDAAHRLDVWRNEVAALFGEGALATPEGRAL